MRWFRWRQKPEFCILLPVHRPPDLLPYALQSILAQTEQTFELHIICDGAPPETETAARLMARRDRRITAHVHPKGPRNGEIYRDPVIRETQASIICQIADDDLWFPDHLRTIGRLLQSCDFGNTLQVDAGPRGELGPFVCDLSDSSIVSKMLGQAFNFFGPTACGYRRAAYLALPEGWTPAPADIWPDLFMWRKFLRQPGLSARTAQMFTNLHIASPRHRGLSMLQRARVNAEWWRHIRCESLRGNLLLFLQKHFLAEGVKTQISYPAFLCPQEDFAGSAATDKL